MNICFQTDAPFDLIDSIYCLLVYMIRSSVLESFDINCIHMKLNLKGSVFHWAIIECLHLNVAFKGLLQLHFFWET